MYDPKKPWRHDRIETIPNDAFPRAEFGLPIVFHFKPPAEPPDTVLYPAPSESGEKRERMSSPLILKPLALGDGRAIPLILQLNVPSLNAVDLRIGDKSISLAPTTAIRRSTLSTYPGSPLAGSPAGSALEAFIAFARAEGFTEVSS